MLEERQDRLPPLQDQTLPDQPILLRSAQQTADFVKPYFIDSFMNEKMPTLYHNAPTCTDELSIMEAALVLGFRRLPDEESRVAFLDTLNGAV